MGGKTKLKQQPRLPSKKINACNHGSEREVKKRDVTYCKEEKLLHI